MPEFSSSGSEMTEFSSYIDFSVLNPPTFFFLAQIMESLQDFQGPVRY